MEIITDADGNYKQNKSPNKFTGELLKEYNKKHVLKNK